MKMRSPLWGAGIPIVIVVIIFIISILQGHFGMQEDIVLEYPEKITLESDYWKKDDPNTYQPRIIKSRKTIVTIIDEINKSKPISPRKGYSLGWIELNYGKESSIVIGVFEDRMIEIIARDGSDIYKRVPKNGWIHQRAQEILAFEK